MSTLTKSEMIDRSIENIFRLLYDIGRDPFSYAENEQILNALRSQGNLCSLDTVFTIRDEELPIRPISLNTLKNRLARNDADRDLLHLDKLRIHAQTSIQKLSDAPAASDKRSRTALEQKLASLEAEVSSLHAANMVLIQALEVNRRDLITIADTSNNGLRQRRISQAIDRIIKILGINPAPFNDVTLLSMTKHLSLVPK